MTLLKSFTKAITAVALFSMLGSAGATTISGNFNQHGYDVVNISVATGSTVDLSYTGGYGDPMLALFDGAGAHLVTNDDSNGLYSHITQNLAAGNYSIVVTYCCNMISALPGTNFSSTDGFNSGSYWFGGSATLASVQAYMDAFDYGAGQPYEFALTNADLTNHVPEPQTTALFGVALAALALVRRRTQQRA